MLLVLGWIDAIDPTDPTDPTDPIEPVKGTWIQTGGRWWYRYEDGTYPCNEVVEIGDALYGFDSAGWMVTGWYPQAWTWTD